ncbi:hypothetical protein ORL86_21180 [Klebsiella michiganensis]|uniref:hypothetical protein n=1 Tax=Klebsiella michiganensis TaxID=1134687 RepID=UPI0022456817|nr:hypothetical protein [Klebsiella michiganensis]MCW9461919.1 hypothetical protein [Klebsiella michiganensis]
MTLEIVPGSLTSPDPSIKNYAPYAPAIGVTGYIDRWRPALDFAAAAVGDTVLSYPSPLSPANVLVGDTVAPPEIIDDSGLRMINCATLGATSALTDTNRKFNTDATFLIVWKETAGGAVPHGILTAAGLRFGRASASWSISKLSGTAGTTLTISNDVAAGGVTIGAKMYAAVVSIPADGTQEVSLTLIGAGQSPVTKKSVVARGGSLEENRRFRMGKDAGNNAVNGPLYAELVVWDRLLTSDEITIATSYVTENYNL